MNGKGHAVSFENSNEFEEKIGTKTTRDCKIYCNLCFDLTYQLPDNG